MTFFEELQWRGLIKDTAGDDLADKLNGEPITFYWGTDPTADSLHLGHYSSLVTAKRLAKAGQDLLGTLDLLQSVRLFLRSNLLRI